VPRVTLNRVAGYRRSTEEDNGAQLFAQSRTLWIRQVDGLNLSTVIETSPLRTVGIVPRTDFHEVSRAIGPKGQVGNAGTIYMLIGQSRVRTSRLNVHRQNLRLVGCRLRGDYKATS
jgi:hypothetical protein